MLLTVGKCSEREQVEDTDLHELHSSTEPSLFLSVQHLSISYIEDLIADNIRVLLFWGQSGELGHELPLIVAVTVAQFKAFWPFVVQFDWVVTPEGPFNSTCEQLILLQTGNYEIRAINLYQDKIFGKILFFFLISCKFSLSSFDFSDFGVVISQIPFPGKICDFLPNKVFIFKIKNYVLHVCRKKFN